MGSQVLHRDGAVWNPATGESADGRYLVRVPTQRLFAVAWQDIHGPGAVDEQEAGNTPT